MDDVTVWFVDTPEGVETVEAVALEQSAGALFFWYGGLTQAFAPGAWVKVRRSQ